MKGRKNIRSYKYRPYPPYPNEAAPDYYVQKLLDIAVGILSCFGLIAAIVFLGSIT